MKWNLKKAAVLAFLCFLIGTGGLYYLYQANASSLGETVPVNLEKTFDSTGVTSASFTTDVLNVTTVPADSNKIGVRVSGDAPKLDDTQWTIEGQVHGGKLQVRVVTKNRFFTGIDVRQLFNVMLAATGSKLNVEVSLPQNMYDSLSFRTDTGNLALNGVQASSLKTSSDTGNIRLSDSAADQIDLQSDTGNITAQLKGGEITAHSDTGNVDIGLDAANRKVAVKTSTGNISIQVKDESPLRLDFRSDTGKVSANLPNIRYERKDKHVLVGSVGADGPLMKAESDTGNITVAGSR